MERKSLIRAGIIAGAALVVSLLLWAFWPSPSVEGATPTERVASVIRMTDERPMGAERTLGRTAVASQEHVTVRQAALVGLARFPRNDSRPYVEQSLTDKDPEIRAAAGVAMGAYDDVAAADALGAIILESHDKDDVRIGAIQGVERETNPTVHRRALIEAYAKLGMHYYFTDSGSETEAQRLGAAEFFKAKLDVQEAYRQAGWPLDRRPAFQLPSVHKAKAHVDNE
ncbi:MAG: HEAT repeat domain-containing protein [Planctomycetota bacterium]|nr:HEAT repeat domain-containing protein [Planctomycetota bacterium]